MRCRCRVDLVDALCRDINGALESKGHVGSPQIVVDRLWQRHDIQPLLAQKICRLVRAVTAKDHETVKAELVIIVLHRLHLVQPVLVRIAHILERHP